MNMELSENPTRNDGITFEFKESDSIIFPSLSESGEYFDGKASEHCELQGYFYDEEIT